LVFNRKAAALVSGGLDSILAAKLMLAQGIEVVGLHFIHPLCSIPPKPGRKEHDISSFCHGVGFEILPVDMGVEFQDVVRKPRFGRGTGMNPCIDCHAFMLKKAALMLDELGASFLVTGEVLGQRPMSQHRQALDLIERDTGLKGRLLRPLSALLMEPTEPETAGMVDRLKLLDISGRGRDRQIALAASFGITGYPAPAGGCLLTDRNFADRLKDAYARVPGALEAREIELLKLGRHYRLPSGAKAVIGRDAFENERIFEFAPPDCSRLSPVDFPGPSAVVCGGTADDANLVATAIIGLSSKAPEGARVLVEAGGEQYEILPATGFNIESFRKFSVGAR
jgi:hypothetical protein